MVRLMAAGVLRPRGRLGGLDLVLNQVPAVLGLVGAVVLLVLADEPLVGELLALVAVALVGEVAGVVVDSDLGALVAATWWHEADVCVVYRTLARSTRDRPSADTGEGAGVGGRRAVITEAGQDQDGLLRWGAPGWAADDA